MGIFHCGMPQSDLNLHQNSVNRDTTAKESSEKDLVRTQSPANSQRTLPRELRRLQLIESTIDCIAKRGLTDTRMADVAAGAGLSVGIVNFHFDSKTTLLAETLRYLADEYHQAWIEARNESDEDPAKQLLSLTRMNFEPRICNQRRIAVWYAFFGEARSRPTYSNLCQQLDDDYLDQMRTLFGSLFDDGNERRAHRASLMLMALWDGLWQNILLNPDVFNTDEAVRACEHWLACMLPEHFKQPDNSA
ncbi:MAG: hypothetical protein DHS20C01_25860 [marine bacterium B5-7]|nr:MAG: hypothetical protein DHS20C01_25860 [marine bacterium B5-7]